MAGSSSKRRLAARARRAPSSPIRPTRSSTRSPTPPARTTTARSRSGRTCSSSRREPLAEALRVVGAIETEIFLSADAPDADLWVKLEDVAPDGTAWNLSSPGTDVLRASDRDGGASPKPLSAGEVVPIRLPNLRTGNLFAKGHRVRVVLCGSFMPHFSRNLQTGESETRSAKMRKATIRIHHDAGHPSRLVLPVVGSWGQP